MPESREPVRLDGQSLAEVEKLLDQRKLPPVDQWNPSHCGHSGMRIGRDGTWYHEGARIERPAMVRLFSTILRREPDGRHVLVTPVEKLDIDVELAAFVATAMRSEGEGKARQIGFELNNGDAVLLGPDHPLRVVDGIPILTVRNGLEASLSRSVYYELADLALAGGDGAPGVWSRGTFFPLQAE